MYCKPRLDQFYIDQFNGQQVRGVSNISFSDELPCKNDAPCFNICNNKQVFMKPANHLKSYNKSIIGK